MISINISKFAYLYQNLKDIEATIRYLLISSLSGGTRNSVGMARLAEPVRPQMLGVSWFPLHSIIKLV